MTVQAVVFDIGNVLIEWNPERFYDATLGEERRRAMFEAVPILAMNERVDLGAVWADEVAALAARHPDWAEPISHWHHRWIEMASPEIPGSVRLLRALRGRGVPVFALSNFGRETFAHALAHYPFLGEFDRAFVSGHLALAKPDAAIYEAVERDSGVAPGSLLFADDRPENIEAARARGWRTHLFTGPEGFAERLVAEGLLTLEDAA
nr:HAD family phosphatase [Rubellimicrobium mesophilum]